MTAATAKPLAVKFCHNKKLLVNFKKQTSSSTSAKGHDYLETKRAAFAILLFIK